MGGRRWSGEQGVVEMWMCMLKSSSRYHPLQAVATGRDALVNHCLRNNPSKLLLARVTAEAGRKADATPCHATLAAELIVASSHDPVPDQTETGRPQYRTLSQDIGLIYVTYL